VQPGCGRARRPDTRWGRHTVGPVARSRQDLDQAAFGRIVASNAQDREGDLQRQLAAGRPAPSSGGSWSDFSIFARVVWRTWCRCIVRVLATASMSRNTADSPFISRWATSRRAGESTNARISSARSWPDHTGAASAPQGASPQARATAQRGAVSRRASRPLSPPGQPGRTLRLTGQFVSSASRSVAAITCLCSEERGPRWKTTNSYESDGNRF